MAEVFEQTERKAKLKELSVTQQDKVFAELNPSPFGFPGGAAGSCGSSP